MFYFITHLLVLTRNYRKKTQCAINCDTPASHKVCNVTRMRLMKCRRWGLKWGLKSAEDFQTSVWTI
jgi:hypothetical protein